MKSLCDKMVEAFNLSLTAAYSEVAPDGALLTPREELTAEEANLVYGWADGLNHKYYENVSSGRCSLNAMANFDIEKFEQSVEADIVKLNQIVAKYSPPVKLTFETMKARGYRGAWAGE